MAQLKIPLDAQRFAKGLTWKDYMAQMGDTRARTEDNYAKSALTEEERKFFSGIGQRRCRTASCACSSVIRTPT